MDGKEIVRIIEAKLFELGISKGKFYKDCGLNSATMSNWRNGIFTPSPAKLHIIEEYLDVTFSNVSKIETTGMDTNLAELLDSIRSRPDLGVLLRSARDVHIVISRLSDIVKNMSGRLVTTNPTTLYGLINGLCKKNGLPEVGVHGLRHSYISLCFHLGWDMKTVMREGGYSNLQTVNDVYRHLAAQDANADIAQMIDFFSQSGQKSSKCFTT